MTTGFAYHEWLTAAEIADLSLPGLPVTKRKVNERVAVEGWAARTSENGYPLARRRRESGGGMEYHVSLLPLAALSALRRGLTANDAASATSGKDGPDMWAWFRRQGATTKATAQRWLKIIQAVEAQIEAGRSVSAAVKDVAAAWGVGVSTINGFRTALETVPVADRLPYLAPRHGGGRAKAGIDDVAWHFLKSDYLRPERPAWEACYRRLVNDYAAPRGLTVPSSMTLRRKLEAELAKTFIKAQRYGAEALRKSIPPQKRSVLDLHALEAVNIDGHTFDVFVRAEDGTIFRPVMVGIQDVFSRKLLAYRIGETECTMLTRLAFADLFRDHGIPRKCVLDNGRAFASKAITGGAKTRFRFKIKDTDHTGILVQLGVDPHWTLPYRGSSKPIERAWEDLCEEIAKHPMMMGAYTGNKPGAKPENYGSRAIPVAEFRAFVARQVALHNARPGRDAEAAQAAKAAGTGGDCSFDAIYAASYAVSPIGKASEDAMLMALLIAENRTCDRDNGSISFHGNRYWSEDLLQHTGSKVTIRFDPDNLHAPVHVYTTGGVYLCAAPAIAPTGFFDVAGAKRRAALEGNLSKAIKRTREAEAYLNAHQFAELMADPRTPSPASSPAVVRPVRHRGQTAAALKQTQQAEQYAAEPQFMDGLFAGVRRLRPVDD